VWGVNARTLFRAAIMASAAVVMMAATSPVFAQNRDDGDDPGQQLTVLENLLLFVVAPLGLFLLISLLVLAPSIAKGPRYRPGLSWWAEPVWFSGPSGLEAGDTDSIIRAAEPTRDGGGASARW
jgi:hypothetical protein